MSSFETYLDRYAELAVKSGVNVQKGQILHITSPIESADFVRQVVKKAYEVGAADVVIEWTDETVTRTRFELAPDSAFEKYPEWQIQKMEELVEKGAAFMTVFSQNPDLLNGIDSNRVATSQKAFLGASSGYRSALMNGKVSRTVLCTPNTEWAKKVYPELSEEEAVQALWDAIFKMTRIDTPDPLQSWLEHRDALMTRLTYLNDQQFKALHYEGGGTNLTIELPDQHIWIGGGITLPNGVDTLPNIPTEEVFTAPKKYGVNGVVMSTTPLNYQGTLIDQFTLTFEKGRIVDAKAERGEDTLKRLIETDDSAHYLGEVALVPHNSPISQTGRVFYNPLIDENASCHLAIGTAYAFNIEGGTSMSPEELETHQINSSLTHVDFMMGSSTLNIDGDTQDGLRIPIFRNGNWVTD